MRQLAFAAAIAFCTALVVPQVASAAHPKAFAHVPAAQSHFALGAVRVQVGAVALNQRLVPVFQAWVNEPYVWWQNVPDPTTGTIYRVPRIAYNRRLVWVFYDRVTGNYGYFDSLGNPVPYYRNRW